jgi:hypothetical protein
VNPELLTMGDRIQPKLGRTVSYFNEDLREFISFIRPEEEPKGLS